MCKHIHLLCKYRKKCDNIEPETHTSDPEDDLHIVEDNNIEEAQAILETLSKTNENSILDKEKACLKADFLALSDSITTIEEARILKKIIASAKPILMASRSEHRNNLPSSIITGPSNKKVLPQRRLYSIKRKRTSTTKQLAKPTFEETTSIAASLIINSTTRNTNTSEAAVLASPSVNNLLKDSPTV